MNSQRNNRSGKTSGSYNKYKNQGYRYNRHFTTILFFLQAWLTRN